MGWLFLGCVFVYWFSVSECGSKIVFWNVVYNVGGGIMVFIVVWGIIIIVFINFGYLKGFEGVFIYFVFLVFIIVVILYVLIRDIF